jgi:hypothetical protein
MKKLFLLFAVLVNLLTNTTYGAWNEVVWISHRCVEENRLLVFLECNLYSQKTSCEQQYSDCTSAKLKDIVNDYIFALLLAGGKQVAIDELRALERVSYGE